MSGPGLFKHHRSITSFGSTKSKQPGPVPTYPDNITSAGRRGRLRCWTITITTDRDHSRADSVVNRGPSLDLPSRSSQSRWVVVMGAGGLLVLALMSESRNRTRREPASLVRIARQRVGSSRCCRMVSGGEQSSCF